MKKIMLSLATIGVLSGVYAEGLSDAIKNFSVNGNFKIKTYVDSNKNYKRKYVTEGEITFGSPVANNMQIIFGLNTKNIVYNNSNGKNFDSNIKNNLFYLNGHFNSLFYNLGKIRILTPITVSKDRVRETTGTGIITAFEKNKNSNQIALIGGFIDNIDNVNQLSSNSINNNIKTMAFVISNKNNIFQTWYFNMKNLIKNEYVIKYEYKLNNYNYYNNDNSSTKIDLIYARSNITNSLRKKAKVSSNSQKYLNIDVKYNSSLYFGTVGYAKTYKNGGVVSLDSYSPISHVLPTEQLIGITNTENHHVYYFSSGLHISNNISSKIAYSNISDKTKLRNNQKEYLLSFKYKYNKKFQIKTYYSYLIQHKYKNNKELYVEANYKF